MCQIPDVGHKVGPTRFQHVHHERTDGEKCVIVFFQDTAIYLKILIFQS